MPASNEPTSTPGGDGLTGVLRDIVPALGGDRYLLGGLAAAIVVVLVAVAGPDGGQIYAGIAAGVLVIAIFVRAFVDLRAVPARRTSGARAGVGPVGNLAEASDRSTVKDVEQDASGGSNVVSASGRSRVRGVRQRSGAGRTPPDET